MSDVSVFLSIDVMRCFTIGRWRCRDDCLLHMTATHRNSTATFNFNRTETHVLHTQIYILQTTDANESTDKIAMSSEKISLSTSSSETRMLRRKMTVEEERIGNYFRFELHDYICDFIYPDKHKKSTYHGRHILNICVIWMLMNHHKWFVKLASFVQLVC
jgi:hypothetical protein